MLATSVAFIAISSVSLIHAAVKTSPSDKAKAQYILNNALKQSSKENPYLYLRLLDKAYEADPSDEYISFLKGLETDSVKDALMMMRPYVDKHPDDKYVAVPYIGNLVKVGNAEEAFRRLSRLTEAMPENTELRDFELAICSEFDSIDRALRVINDLETIGLPGDEILNRRMSVYHRPPVDDEKILEVMRDHIATHPEDSTAMPLYIQYSYDFDHKEEAYELARKYLDSQPRSYSRLILMGQMALFDEKDSLATEMFRRAMDSDDVDADQLFIILAEAGEGRFPELIDEVVNRFPDSENLKPNYVLYNVMNGNWTAADSILENNPGINITNENVVYAAMSAKIRKDKPKDALAIYDKAAAKDLTNLDILLLRLGAYSQLRDEKSFISLRDSMLGVLLPGVKDFDNLKPLPYSDLVASASTISGIYVNEAEFYHNIGDFDKCVRASRNALLFSPDNAEIFNNYAYFISELTDDPSLLAEALEMSKRSIEIAPNATKFDTLAWILFKLKRYDEALAIMEKLIEGLEPTEMDVEYLNHLGDIYYMKGATDKALEMWNKALSLSPTNENIARKINAKQYIPTSFGQK